MGQPINSPNFLSRGAACGIFSWIEYALLCEARRNGVVTVRVVDCWTTKPGASGIHSHYGWKTLKPAHQLWRMGLLAPDGASYQDMFHRYLNHEGDPYRVQCGRKTDIDFTLTIKGKEKLTQEEARVAMHKTH